MSLAAWSLIGVGTCLTVALFSDHQEKKAIVAYSSLGALCLGVWSFIFWVIGV